jgi:hypothetical protein
MEEAPHAHGHAPHGTGFRWLDMGLALSAFIVSLSSLWLTVHNAHTMERLVTANSYPNIDVNYGNQFDFQDGRGARPALYLSLNNSGVGPARLRSVELSFGGKSAASLHEVLDLCCTQEPAAVLPKTDYWSSGDMSGWMVQAGKEVNLFAWAQAPGDPRWARANEVRDKIGVRVCYCSVFEECYVRASERREPVRVNACPLPAVPYRGD